MRAFRRSKHDESGMSLVFVGLGMMAFVAATMLAIDVGMLMTARNQAQNAADAGALAGAVAMFYDDNGWEDRSATGPAVTSAIAAAQANTVMKHLDKSGAAGVVDVTPDDVVFLNDAMGEPTQVQVTVHRNSARGNPISTFIAGLFGNYTTSTGGKYANTPTVGVTAVATAEVSPANAMTCVKPFTIPDKWKEMNDPPWTSDSKYDAFDNKSNPLPKCATPGPGCADIYIPAADCDKCPTNPDYTGYNNVREKGQRLVIRARTGTNIEPSMYFSLAIGGMDGTGGSDYEENIRSCNRTIMHWGERLYQEPGAMMGPTVAGIQALIAQDPNARWDDGKNDIVGSTFEGSQSPRVFPIPLYDPAFYDEGRRNGRMADLKVANWIGFFAESAQSNGIYGRIIPIGGIRDKYSDAPTNLFPKAIRLVR